jgi:hypothetical protein
MKIAMSCPQCGVVFDVMSEYQARRRRYCSRRCRSLATRGRPAPQCGRPKPKGAASPSWKGGRAAHSGGYVEAHAPGHPKASGRGRVLEHVLVAEKALGKHLPPGAVVHHVNGDRADNQNSNLVICEDQLYHMLLHKRARIAAAGGDPRAQAICGTCSRVLARAAFGRLVRRTRRTVDTIMPECRECTRARRRAA